MRVTAERVKHYPAGEVASPEAIDIDRQPGGGVLLTVRGAGSNMRYRLSPETWRQVVAAME